MLTWENGLALPVDMNDLGGPANDFILEGACLLPGP